MRFLMIAAALLLPLAAVPAQSFERYACGAKAEATTADLSAKTKKPIKKAAKKPKDKVEYMRAAPMK
jgi:uncharacterized protein YpuA (DUF1002 family)